MSQRRFPIGVVLGAAALVVGLLALGATLANTALAGGPSFGGPHWAGHWAGGPGFAAFDDLRQGRPFTLEVTPGTVTAASQTSLTVQTKDGTSKTFTLDAQTRQGATPANGEQVVVVTKNGAPSALAVFGPHGGRGWWGAG
ncbi:MAG TPA: hypothetical protein VGL23_04340 [Chloroflexota bacterium]